MDVHAVISHNVVIAQLTEQVDVEQSYIDTAACQIKTSEEIIRHNLKVIAEGEAVIANLHAAIEALRRAPPIDAPAGADRRESK